MKKNVRKKNRQYLVKFCPRATKIKKWMPMGWKWASIEKQNSKPVFNVIYPLNMVIKHQEHYFFHAISMCL